MRPRINIKASSPYLPLFQRGSTRYKLVLGGRGSAKSFTVATALIDRTYDDYGTILFTRYTLVNAEVSILPEFVDKIERLGLQGDFTKSGNDLVNIRTGGRILFRGIKTSSGINTAALKSIPKLKMWVNDESEELVDETIFDTIDLSIRYNDAPAEVWLVANPPDIDHFLYRRFFKQRGIEDVWNGTKDDVTYIWTTYLTNPHLPDEYVALAERSKAVDMAYYEHVWLGHFATHKEGLIYKGWKEVTDAEWPLHLPCWYGCDWGFSNDPAAVLRVTYDPATHTVWLRELMYETGMLTADIARAIRRDIQGRDRIITIGKRQLLWRGGVLSCDGKVLDLTQPDDALDDAGFRGWEVAEARAALEAIERCDGEVYCDPARPEQIREMKINHGLWAMPAVNTDKVGRIEYLKYFDVRYIGDNIRQEVNAYCWEQSKNDKTQYINKPQDGNDHCFVADTIIATPEGGKRIAEIREGEIVLTSEGPRVVEKFWKNGYKEIRRYRLNFVTLVIEIEATKEHKVKTTNGWKQLNELKKGDEIFLLKSLTENCTTAIRAKNTTHGITSGCTASCGSTTTALSLRGIISTISTATRRIMTSAISHLSKAANIKADTSASRTQTPKSSSKRKSECGRLENSQKRGTKAPKGVRGIVSIASRKSASSAITFAPSAESRTEAKTQRQNTAPTSATQRHGAIAGSITRFGTARSAGKSSRPTVTQTQNVAASLVLQNIEETYIGEREVFDLTVADIHEYIAAGIVVHNCMDAASYGVVTHLRRQGIANKLGEQ